MKGGGMAKRSKKSKSKRVTLKQKHKAARKVKEHHKKKAKKLGLNRKPRGVEKDIGIPNDLTRVVNVEDNSEERVELVNVIELCDVIVEVLDARDPLGTRCTHMENMVMQAAPNKLLVLVLNKIDLVPREAALKWLKYLKEEFPAVVAFKCSTHHQRSNLKRTCILLPQSDCLGDDTLMNLLKNYSTSLEFKKSITVGILGLPNVGKSSLINSLKRAQVVNVGATPGLTKSLQEVRLDKTIKLLDCPGVVMLNINDGSKCKKFALSFLN